LEKALDEPQFVWYATLGIGFFSGAPRDPVSAAEAITAARSSLQILGGRLTLQAAPLSTRERVEFWGAAPSALPLMRELKQRLDPERRLAPGRFVGGI
jgi:glycolate oxidase FAD binding subunit